MEIVARQRGSTASLFFPRHPEADDIDRLAHILELAFGARVIKRLDGLDQRYWNLELAGERLTLHHDTFAGLELSAVGDGPRALLAVLHTQLEALELLPAGHIAP